jgi:hypothetical protein
VSNAVYWSPIHQQSGQREGGANPMKSMLFMLSFFLAVQMTGSGLDAQVAPGSAKAAYRAEGWTIPGIKHPDHLKVFNLREKLIESTAVQISSIQPDSKTSILDYGSSHSGEVVINEIYQYSLNGKPFCYLVTMSPSREGGRLISAVDFEYAYYDEEGKGLFQTREIVGPSPPPHSAEPYPVHLPNWIKKAIQK